LQTNQFLDFANLFRGCLINVLLFFANNAKYLIFASTLYSVNK